MYSCGDILSVSLSWYDAYSCGDVYAEQAFRCDVYSSVYMCLQDIISEFVGGEYGEPASQCSAGVLAVQSSCSQQRQQVT